VLFGERADYLLEVVLDDDEEGRWRLLVLEDTGELLAADAKQQTGQGLSRLLNLVDGIVGQGLPVLVLVMTNEPLRTLHPAVARPGRCAAKIEFVPFPGEEAAEWLAARGRDTDAAQAATLANLFAGTEAREPEPRRPIGFGV
jgi:SpoVK/Ycf46/Vps4 family AAA+-type ATPase